MSIEASRRQPFQQEPGVPWNGELRDYLRTLYRDADPFPHDSVVIAGADLAALTFAATLARSERLAGRIVMVAPTRRMTRRLQVPVAVHDRALAALSEILGARGAALLHAALGHRRTVGGRTTVLHGMRHDCLEAALRTVTEGMGVTHIAGCPAGPGQLLRLARGANPLLVNATGNPLLLGNAVEPPRRHLVAVQCAFREAGAIRPAAIEWGQSVPDRASAGARFAFMPFADPLSPDATWCGQAWRPRRGGLPEAWPGSDPSAEALFAAAQDHGLVPVAPEQTLGWLARPLPAGRADPGSIAHGRLELRRIWEAAPAPFLIDAQAATAVGREAAEAILQGASPIRVAERTVQSLRWRSVAGRLAPAGGWQGRHRRGVKNHTFDRGRGTESSVSAMDGTLRSREGE